MGGDSMVNPPQRLGYKRFGNDMLLDFYKAERDAIEAICPGKPWYMMEHSTSAVQWKPLNTRKRAGELWELDGVPAITSHPPHGQGAAIYVGCDLGRHDITHLLTELNTTAPSDERAPDQRPGGGEINAATTTAAATTHDPPHPAHHPPILRRHHPLRLLSVRSSPLPSTALRENQSSPTGANPV